MCPFLITMNSHHDIEMDTCCLEANRFPFLVVGCFAYCSDLMLHYLFVSFTCCQNSYWMPGWLSFTSLCHTCFIPWNVMFSMELYVNEFDMFSEFQMYYYQVFQVTFMIAFLFVFFFVFFVMYVTLRTAVCIIFLKSLTNCWVLRYSLMKCLLAICTHFNINHECLSLSCCFINVLFHAVFFHVCREN